jgi:G3E family GTPase
MGSGHDEASRPAERIPVTVLTGFLGAGKTTLLNRILNGEHGLKVGVLVNDFGSINIDADLVVDVATDVISLANGCVCCSIRDDLSEAVIQVIERPERPEYILLEASGVAEPTGIALTFVDDSSLFDRVRLDSIICVVDAEQVFAAPEQMELKIWQVATADMLILNKIDLVAQELIERIRDWLDEHLHRYRLIEANRCDVPLDVLLGVGRFQPGLETDRVDHPPGCSDPGCSHAEHAGHDHRFQSWSYETDRPLSLERLGKVAAKLPADVYRAKGVVAVAEAPERRVVLQVVGKRVDVSFDGEWGGRSPRTRIVAIGAAGTIGPGDLAKHFVACLADGDGDDATAA